MMYPVRASPQTAFVIACACTWAAELVCGANTWEPGNADDGAALVQTSTWTKTESGPQLLLNRAAALANAGVESSKDLHGMVQKELATRMDAHMGRLKKIADGEEMIMALNARDDGVVFEPADQPWHPSEFQRIKEEMRLGMRALSPGLDAESVSLLEATGMKFNYSRKSEHVKDKIAAMGKVWRESRTLHEQILNDFVPRLTELLTHENLWKQLKGTAHTLGNSSSGSATPFSLEPVLGKFPTLTRSGAVAIRRAGLVFPKQAAKREDSVDEGGEVDAGETEEDDEEDPEAAEEDAASSGPPPGAAEEDADLGAAEEDADSTTEPPPGAAEEEDADSGAAEEDADSTTEPPPGSVEADASISIEEDDVDTAREPTIEEEDDVDTAREPFNPFSCADMEKVMPDTQPPEGSGLDSEEELKEFKEAQESRAQEYIKKTSVVSKTFRIPFCRWVTRTASYSPACFTGDVAPKFEGSEGIDFYAKGGTYHGLSWSPKTNSGLGASLSLAIQGFATAQQALDMLQAKKASSKLVFTAGMGVSHTWPSGWSVECTLYFDFMNPCDAESPGMPYNNYNIALTVSKGKTSPAPTPAPSFNQGELKAAYTQSSYAGAGAQSVKKHYDGEPEPIKTTVVGFDVSLILGKIPIAPADFDFGIKSAISYYASPAKISKSTLSASWVLAPKSKQMPWPSTTLFFVVS